MSLRVDPEFEALIPPLTPDEDLALRKALESAGRALDPIKTWRGLVIDGHNRFRICSEMDLPYETQDLSDALDSREAVKRWMLDHQMARRNLSREQRFTLQLLHGAEPLAPPSDLELLREAIAEGKADKILSGHTTMRMLMAAKRRKNRPPRGPSKHPAIPKGHELAGTSTLTDQDGEVKAEWNKTRIHGADETPTEIPDTHLVKSTSVMQRGDGTTSVQWTKYAVDEKRREDALREAWARHVELYKGLADPAKLPESCDDELITLYPLGDPHIGMRAWAPETGDNFDTEIACRELLACVKMLVDGAANSKQAIITNLGDFMHAQDDTAKTPGHGNQLDVDGRFAKVLDAGHALLRGIVDAALERHDHVTVRNLPGNHDPRVAAELAMWLKAVYEREPRVTVADPYRAHQYDRFGKCLFGWHHGDRCKASELPALMAADRAEDWGMTTERVWHVGHVHHLTRSETPGCIVETHRTMAGPDAWHAGRYRAGRSLSAITYHREHGETDRKTVNLSRVRAALAP